MPRDPNPHSLTPDLAPTEHGYALSYLAHLSNLGFARRYGRPMHKVERPQPRHFNVTPYRARVIRDRVDGWALTAGQWYFTEPSKEKDTA